MTSWLELHLNHFLLRFKLDESLEGVHIIILRLTYNVFKYVHSECLCLPLSPIFPANLLDC